MQHSQYLLRAYLWAARSSYVLGAPKEALQFLSKMPKLAEQIRDHHWLGQAYHALMELHGALGDWNALREFADKAAKLNSRHFAQSLFLANLEFQIGNFTKGDELSCSKEFLFTVKAMKGIYLKVFTDSIPCGIALNKAS